MSKVTITLQDVDYEGNEGCQISVSLTDNIEGAEPTLAMIMATDALAFIHRNAEPDGTHDAPANTQ